MIDSIITYIIGAGLILIFGGALWAVEIIVRSLR